MPAGTPLDLFYDVRRDANQADPPMEWDFPVTAGEELEIRLYFVEFSRCSAGNRLFDVTIEGTIVLDDFDVYTEAGSACNVAIMRSFIVTPLDGNLDIDFPLSNNRPSIIAGFEILSTDGTAADMRTADLTVVHTGTNGNQVVNLSGEALPDTGGNNPPSAGFTFAVNDLTVTFTDTSTDSDGSVVSWSWDFGDGATSTEQNPVHTYGAYGTYTVSLTVTDDMGATGGTSQDVVVADPNAAGAFLEADGMVVMEAENFHANIARDNHDWVSATTHAGFSGASYMVTEPDDATQIKKNPEGVSPEMSYDVEFGTTGDYYLWGRVWAPHAKSNSVHIGIDGAVPSTINGLQTVDYEAWVWVDLIKAGVRATISVGTSGLHTIHVWMREDGLAIDKIVMTTDAAFTPTGEGPAESPRASAPAVAKAGNGLKDRLQLDDDPAASEALAGADELLPTEYALETNYPNPFNPTTTIQFALPEASSVRLEVFDTMGRRIATLVDAELGAGRHEARWDGRTDSGAAVASGVYLYRIQAGAFTAARTMMLVK